MTSHKLFDLLSALNRREMTRFREFAESPWFNKHQELRALVAHLSHIYPDFDERHCGRAALFQQLFPEETHDQARLALLFTYARRLMEQFLAYEQFRQDEGEQQLLLLQALRRRKLFDLYEKTLQHAERETQEQHRSDSRLYYALYRLADEADNYFTEIERRRSDDSLQLKENHLDRFYLAEKLRDACEMQVRRHILKVDYSSRLLEAVLKEVGDNLPEYAREPSIYVYYRIYLMVSRDEPQYYFDALDGLWAHEAAFDPANLAEIYNYFQNYCIRRINKGEERFLEEIFRLYQRLLEKELLYENGLLSEWHYKNIVTTGIRLRQMDWVKQFIENQKDRLDSEVRDNAYRFNLASYHHALGQYDEVLRLLLQVEYSDLRYSLGAKALLLRTYYELREFEALDSLVGSMRQFLQRNQLMADFHRNGHHNLFKFTRRAAHIRAQLGFANEQKSRAELDRLRNEVAHAGEIFNKSWLIEKMEALEREV
jgi:hypothetical protein